MTGLPVLGFRARSQSVLGGAQAVLAGPQPFWAGPRPGPFRAGPGPFWAGPQPAYGLVAARYLAAARTAARASGAPTGVLKRCAIGRYSESAHRMTIQAASPV